MKNGETFRKCRVCSLPIASPFNPHCSYECERTTFEEKPEQTDVSQEEKL